MRVLIFGASGMVGMGVLLECLDDPRVESVLVVGRSPSGRRHSKLREILHGDFFNYDAIHADLIGLDACFFCLGTTAAGKGETEYTRLTHDLTLAAARALLEASSDLVFCYVSGQGTDSTECSRMMWARVKGRTENALLALPFRAAFMFRPGLIQPLRGIRSKTALYQFFISGLGWLMPLFRRLFPDQITTTEILGRAMIEAAATTSAPRIVDIRHINALGNKA